jgi:DNA-directed RNA polymerase subunit F
MLNNTIRIPCLEPQMSIDPQFFKRCILTLDQAYKLLQESELESIQYEMYRSACVKEFELILGQLNENLSDDLFAINQSRWMAYSEIRYSAISNNAHSTETKYQKYCEKIMNIIPVFSQDVRLILSAQPHPQAQSAPT